ncbi:hypothetical protein L9F63_016860, partial [Diploptera punctata]
FGPSPNKWRYESCVCECLILDNDGFAIETRRRFFMFAIFLILSCILCSLYLDIEPLLLGPIIAAFDIIHDKSIRFKPPAIPHSD